MRTLDDLHQAFAALANAAPTELTDPVVVPSSPHRVGRLISLTAVAAAVAIIAVVVPWGIDRQSHREAPPAGPDPGLTQPILAPSSLATLRAFSFHVEEVSGFAPSYSWEVTPDGQTTSLRWVEHGYDVRIDVAYQARSQDDRPDRPASAQSVSVHGAAGYYVEEPTGGPQPRSNARLVWEYAPESWAKVSVSGLPPDAGGSDDLVELPAQTETRAALLAIAQAVRSGGPPARLPFRLGPTPASLPSGDTAWRMAVFHQGRARWSATLGLGHELAAPTIVVTSGGDAFQCAEGDETYDSAPMESFTYRGYAGCLVRNAIGGRVTDVILQVGVQQRSIHLNENAPPAPLTYPLADLKRVLADLTVASSGEPDDWFDLPTALSAG